MVCCAKYNVPWGGAGVEEVPSAMNTVLAKEQCLVLPMRVGGVICNEHGVIQGAVLSVTNGGGGGVICNEPGVRQGAVLSVTNDGGGYLQCTRC